jgi:hypothetical protein
VHGLPLEIGAAALDDPLAVSRPDRHPDGDRRDTIAVINGVALFIVHTYPDDDDRLGRVIRVRKATTHERKAYENGDY